MFFLLPKQRNISRLPFNTQRIMDYHLLKCSHIHINPTRFSSSECLYLPPSKSVTYGMKSITNHCIYSWNTLTENLDKPSTHSITTVKKIMCNKFIANYWFDIRKILHTAINKLSYEIHWSLLPSLPLLLALSFSFSRMINF